MSMNLTIKGTFKNGKKRTLGTFSSVGMEYKNQFDNDDAMFISRRLEEGKMCFNRCIELNKFDSIMVTFYGSYCNNHGEGKRDSEWGLILDESKRIDAQELIKEVNDIIISFDEEVNGL